MEDAKYWNCSATKGDGEKYYIEGLNIWDYKWKNTGDSFFIKEPTRQLNYKVEIYQIENETKIVKFGATESSNGAWIIYTKYYQATE